MIFGAFVVNTGWNFWHGRASLVHPQTLPSHRITVFSFFCCRLLLWHVPVWNYLGTRNDDTFSYTSDFCDSVHCHVVHLHSSDVDDTEAGQCLSLCVSFFWACQGRRQTEFCFFSGNWGASFWFSWHFNKKLPLFLQLDTSVPNNPNDLKNIRLVGATKHNMALLKMAALLLGCFTIAWIPMQIFVYAGIVCPSCSINDYIRCMCNTFHLSFVLFCFFCLLFLLWSTDIKYSTLSFFSSLKDFILPLQKPNFFLLHAIY